VSKNYAAVITTIPEIIRRVWAQNEQSKYLKVVKAAHS
jgi:hypothetical protein